MEPSAAAATLDENKLNTHDVTHRNVFGCEFVRTTSTGSQKRHKWTDLELHYLECGMEEFGTSWKDILKKYGKPHGPLRNRSAVNLKDKARNEKARRIRNGITLGSFELESFYN
ncbi:14240_t:CDS:1 [Cetraspora pellucida]|uniref:14240_t:CDS:1 n=1 Tax=Cetraspora pellucida TaxID=1433469 RepID=A0A9N8W9R8_9GLOM|nr:14240_t:CDS:1 [Cetraspora pellucida]